VNNLKRVGLGTGCRFEGPNQDKIVVFVVGL